jgi:amino acid permease
MIMTPIVFQQGGWLIGFLVFLTIAFFSGLAGLFTVEAVSRFPGNANFEVSTINVAEC